VSFESDRRKSSHWLCVLRGPVLKIKHMNTQSIESGFTRLGARLKVREIPSRWRQGDRTWISPTDYSLDIQRDGDGEFFELRVPTHMSDSLSLTVVQSEPKQRHLLLFVRKTSDQPQLDRFLCGHDEREWFVAAVPGGASSVRQAMDALQPAPVRQALASNKVSTTKRYARKNRAFRRQGEWFFIPEPSLAVDDKLILRNEPLRRGAGKPHMVEQLFRTGGETVYVCSQHPNGLLTGEYVRLLKANPNSARWEWRMMRRDMGVFARGAVSHADHATITLPFWHRVLMNTETQSRTMAHVAFLD
jgi:hypothetical protein